MCFEVSLNYLHFAALSDFILVPNIDYVATCAFVVYTSLLQSKIMEEKKR